MSRRPEEPKGNPWLPRAAVAVESEPEVEAPTYVSLGPQTPQRGLVQPGTGGLGTWTPPSSARPPWWWVSCHGGAGESTLALAIPQGAESGGRGWPVSSASGRSGVVLVARTHAGGLHAAQNAGRQWASGALEGVDLLGLVAIADAPGPLPKSLQQWLKLVAGGVPRLWRISWNEAWRLGEWPDARNSAKDVRKLASELAGLTNNRYSGE
ncbi:hypothetical protein OG948_32855 [Embleya sp. NBC_00888]|uniref:DUF6668 family protein n=1 Tax=Embleya sp. NBC_00888 TaxID=2975960 RepID=UPI003862DE38|nr:hypothetical protein OG948_32855 [Embleya sp. NBC_00888]